MSLIQEALRRQQEEAGEALPPMQEPTTPEPPPPAPPLPPPAPKPTPTPLPPPAPPPEPPSTPPSLRAQAPPAPAIQATPPSKTPPLPAPPPPEEADADGVPAPVKAKGTLPTLLGILLVILLLVGGAVWMIMFAVQQWKQPDDHPPPPESAAHVETATPASPTSEGPAASTVAPPLPIAKPPHPVAIAKPVAKPAAPPAPPPVAPVKAEPTQPAVTAVEPVEWPTVKLQGVIGRGKNGSAILNNKVLAVNETIEGIRVIAVGKQGVELEYQAERRFIKVGISTH
jgi:cytoskeletal protein RodZ